MMEKLELDGDKPYAEITMQNDFLIAKKINEIIDKVNEHQANMEWLKGYLNAEKVKCLHVFQNGSCLKCGSAEKGEEDNMCFPVCNIEGCKIPPEDDSGYCHNHKPAEKGERCPECNGYGFIGGNLNKCPKCHGTGKPSVVGEDEIEEIIVDKIGSILLNKSLRKQLAHAIAERIK